MAPAHHRKNGNAIVIAGALLGLYLAALIAFGYLGQSRLREALAAQELLSIEKQAATVAYFLADLQGSLDRLSESGQLRTFFANRKPGMPVSGGPQHAGLLAVSRDFERFRDLKRAYGEPAFGSIALVENNGQVLLEVGGTEAVEGNRTHRVRKAPDLGRLRIDAGTEGATLTFTAAVIHRDEPAGYLVAVVDAPNILRPFLADRGDLPQQVRTVVLVDPRDGVVAANRGHDGSRWLSEAQDRGDTVLSANVADTGLRILTLPDLSGTREFFTSPLFLSALTLIALPLLAGVVYLLRLNSHNLVLKRRFQSTTQQGSLLREQNERLQREIDKRVESEQKLAHQANFDQLTGLPNRNLAMDRLAQAIKWAKREGGGVVALFLDLDRFKQVNDSLGHAAGDELLHEAAQRLQAQVRESDTVSRLGGDEFLVICPEMPEHADWERCAKQMLKALAEPFYIGDHEFFVGASIGIAAFPQGGSEPQKLLKNADIAMYAAKEQGRNRYCYYDPSMDAMAIESMRLENNLRHALERDEFHLLFQPIVDMSSGRIVAVEALLRWNNRELGGVPPEKFIPVAEETGLIHEIGEWVLIEACRIVSLMHQDHQFRVSVNLSAKQFNRPGRLLDCVLLALRQSGLMPSQLELEITETILINDRSEVSELINQLDRIGVRLSIDDFGTGYSALNYLQRFPFDVLKIDSSFTSQIPAGDANASLIRAIIAMAHALDLEVIAEGIETREQAGFLLVYHCELGQGNLYSRPVLADELRIQLSGEEAISA